MMKDTFFYLPRFTNLCRKEIVENWRPNVLRIVVVYGVVVIAMVWNGYIEYQYQYNEMKDSTWSFLLVLFVLALWGFGCLSASFTMEKMKDKTTRIGVLMLPATPFEKFFSKWLISTIAFLFIYLISYKLADYTRVLVFTLTYPEKQFIAPVDLSHLVGEGPHYYLVKTSLEFGTLIVSYFFCQSLFLLGSSIWPKNSFIKTFAAVAIIAIVYIFVAALLIKKLVPDRGIDFMSHTQFLTTVIVGGILFTLLNWTLAYFRFKESEIINRM